MTTDTQLAPTNAEIAALYTEQTGFILDDSPAALLDFARAVLAKWGQHAHSGEPVATVQMVHGVTIGYLETAVPIGTKLYAAPQPSPTAPATQQPEGDVVAYLDVGANGYLDLGSELSEDALQQLPKGRHALVIAGTYGIDGYVAAPQPSYTAQAADSVQEDAARYRWLREGNNVQHGAAWHVAVNLYGFEWDAAIDAARKQGANHD